MIAAISSRIEPQFSAQGLEGAVRPAGELHLQDLFPAVPASRQMLSPILDPLDRPPQEGGEEADHDFLGTGVVLDTEASSDIRGDDPYRSLRPAGRFCDVLPGVMRSLGRGPQHDLVGPCVDRSYRPAGLKAHPHRPPKVEPP